MFGDNYILQIAQRTHREIVAAISLRFFALLSSEMAEEDAAKIAAALSNSLFGFDVPAEVRNENRRLMDSKIADLATNAQVREVLSGAAFNMAYGHYIDAGGGRFLNKFLSYVRLDSSANTAGDHRLLSEIEEELNIKNSKILRSILALKSLALWVPRGQNPNEQTYYHAVHKFALAQGVPFAQ